jgi:hypothetical protein
MSGYTHSGVETLARRGYRFIAPLSQPAEATAQVTAHDPKPTRRGFVVPLAAVFAVLVLLLIISINLMGVRDTLRNRTFSGPIRSLAVLPLANLSGDSDQDYFVDGMTDALRQSGKDQRFTHSSRHGQTPLEQQL